MIICFIEEARRERNTVENHRNLVYSRYVLVTVEVQKTNRAYFGKRLLPTIKSDRHPTDVLRPHAVSEIRRELSHSAACILAYRWAVPGPLLMCGGRYQYFLYRKSRSSAAA